MSQEIVGMRLAELIRPKQTKIWPYDGRVVYGSGVRGKDDLVLSVGFLSLSSVGWQEFGFWS